MVGAGAWGDGMDVWMDIRTDARSFGRTDENSPLCSIGQRPLRVRCPKRGKSLSGVAVVYVRVINSRLTPSSRSGMRSATALRNSHVLNPWPSFRTKLFFKAASARSYCCCGSCCCCCCHLDAMDEEEEEEERVVSEVGCIDVVMVSRLFVALEDPPTKSASVFAS